MRSLLLALSLALLAASPALAERDLDAARALAERISPQLSAKVLFKKITSANGKDVYSLANNGQHVEIGGNNANSMAVGLNRYLKKYCNVTVSWFDDVVVTMPPAMPMVDFPETVEALVPQRFFITSCKSDCAMPFWQWNDWEHFIDWMALNGINRPPVAAGQGPLQEQIIARERALNMRVLPPAATGHKATTAITCHDSERTFWCNLGNVESLQVNPKEVGEQLDRALSARENHLTGIGLTLERLDLQQFPCEYLFEKAWNLQRNLTETANEIADRHAGKAIVSVRDAWNILLNEALTAPSSPHACPPHMAYPALGQRDTTRHNVPALVSAWHNLLMQREVTTDAMTVDLVWVGRQLLGDLFGYEKQLFDKAYYARDLQEMHRHAFLMTSILADIDLLNAQHPHSTLHHWLQQARDFKTAPASRNWSGVILGYYAQRWYCYIDEATRAVQAGRDFDAASCNAAISHIQQAWSDPSLQHDEPRDYPRDVLLTCEVIAHKYAQELHNCVSSAGN